MNDDFDVTDTLAPKSDQLNADDLIEDIVVKITGISRGGEDQPIILNISGDRPLMPYKPCKTMRRLMATIWGKKGKEWVGRRLQLFNKTDVMNRGERTGGIRIRAMSGIDKPTAVPLTVSRGKRQDWTVLPLPDEYYPQDLFEKNIQAWSELIAEGKMSVEQVIEKAQQRAKLSDDQLNIIASIKVTK